MRISDWSSDVCSSDLGRALICIVIASVAKQSRTVYAYSGSPRRLRLLAMTMELPEQHHRAIGAPVHADLVAPRSEEHTSELQSLMRISYAVFCLKKKKTHITHTN